MKTILDESTDLRIEIEKVAEVAGYLWTKGWAERNGGNITINVTDMVSDDVKSLKPIAPKVEMDIYIPNLKGAYFYCKGTNKRMRDLARFPMDNGSLIRICDDCKSYEIVADKPVKPTSEINAHLTVHNHLVGSGSSFKAVLHTHPIELVAMSHNPEFLKKDVLTKMLWSMIPETKAFCPKGLGIIPYELPGSVKLADSSLKELTDYDVVMWEKHGVLAVGNDILEAFDQVDVLSKSAQIYIAAKNMGFTPDGMTDEAMQEMTEAFNLPK